MDFIFIRHRWVNAIPRNTRKPVVLYWSCYNSHGSPLSSLSAALGNLDEKSSLPLYQQLQRAIRGAIESRRLGPEDALLPERDLASELNVSRITVRKAIDGLVSEGLLMRRQGSGTFVCARVEKNFSKLTSFSEDMLARGRTPRSVWLHKSTGTVTPEESLTLRASPGTAVYRFHRIRIANDAPMSLEYATILASCLPSVDAVDASLYRALEHAGNRPVRALQRLRAVLLTTQQAGLLQAMAKDPGLLVERLGFLKDGRAAEFTQSFFRGDTYDFVAELSVST
jgi:GntR family transcriptional regulator